MTLIPPQTILGFTETVFELSGSYDNTTAALRLAQQTQRSLCIHTRCFDPKIFDTREYAAAMREMITQKRRVSVRVLVQDVSKIVREGHRLVDLALRLSSFFTLRTPSPEFNQYNDAFIVADSIGYLRQRPADRYEAQACFCARQEATELQKYFNMVWQHSEPHPDLRRLNL